MSVICFADISDQCSSRDHDSPLTFAMLENGLFKVRFKYGSPQEARKRWRQVEALRGDWNSVLVSNPLTQLVNYELVSGCAILKELL